MFVSVPSVSVDSKQNFNLEKDYYFEMLFTLCDFAALDLESSAIYLQTVSREIAGLYEM